MRWRSLLVATLVLGGCQKAEPAQSVNLLKAREAQVEAAEAAAAPDTGQDATPPPIASPTPSGPQLAYSYRYALQLPAANIHAAIAADQAACAAAGPQLCQVTSADEQSMGRDSAQATLELRAAPVWLNRYRAGLAAQVASKGGKIVQATTSAEDLSRSIVDTEAAVRAKTTLRDRLEQLVAQRTGKLSDVLEAERELARVQGEIDTARSELTMMQTRVAMSDLHVDYTAFGVAAPESAMTPLKVAFEGFFGHVIEVIALIIQILSYALPFALIGGAIAWIVMARAKLRPKRAPRPPATP